MNKLLVALCASEFASGSAPTPADVRRDTFVPVNKRPFVDEGIQ
jgi:hypothetical protein